MIVKEAPRGGNTTGLLSYLYGPGKGPERGGTIHIDPRTIASWDRLPVLHEPVPRASGGHSVRDMARTIDLPARLAGRSATNRTGHIVVANAAEDPVLSDDEWREVAEATMRNAGLWNGPQDDAGVRWIATRHDDNSIHITFSRVRENGRDVGYINYTRAWEQMRHSFEARWQLVPTGRADGTSRRPYHQAEASRAKAARHEPGGDPETLPDTAQLRHWCTVIALEAPSEEVFVSRLRAAGVTVLEQHDDRGEVADYRVGVRTDSTGAPVLYNLSKLAQELRLENLRTEWSVVSEPGKPTAAEAVDALERAASTSLHNPSDAELAAIGRGARDTLHAAAAYCGLGELRAAAEAADRAGRLAGQAVAIPEIANGPAAQMARDLRITASTLVRARDDEPDRDTAARIVLAAATVLMEVEAWHELAGRSAAAYAALSARTHLLEARRALTRTYQRGAAQTAVRTTAHRMTTTTGVDARPVRHDPRHR